MPAMSARAPSMQSISDIRVERGLPKVNYYLPVVVTLAATLLILAVVVVLTFMAISNTFAQWNRAAGSQQDGAILSVMLCGLLSLFGLGGLVYFVIATVKGLRDLWTPLHYTRGVVANKRTAGGRRAGNWLVVSPRYAGSDLRVASEITEEQAAASPDRSQIVQPRGSWPMANSGPPTKSSSYLPASRISTSDAGRPVIYDRPVMTTQYQPQPSDTGEEEEKVPRMVFRVDPASFKILEAGDEVLVAHSRFLEHIFYVAHLKGGEWEAFRNRELI
jgi:hypothetical protein